MLYSSAWVGVEPTTSVVIGTDCIGSCISNYYIITATTAPILSENMVGALETDRTIFVFSHIDYILPTLCLFCNKKRKQYKRGFDREQELKTIKRCFCLLFQTIWHFCVCPTQDSGKHIIYTRTH
jgi:hypothetical protein